MSKPDPSELIKPEEVAKILKVDPETLRHWRARGKGPPYVKLDGSQIRYRVGVLQDYIDRCTVTPTIPATATVSDVKPKCQTCGKLLYCPRCTGSIGGSKASHNHTPEECRRWGAMGGRPRKNGDDPSASPTAC